jgi:amino acid permease
MGGIIAYIYFSGKYIGDAISFFTPIPILEEHFRLIMTFGITTFFMFPLSCLKDMRTLGKTSILGLICIGYIVCLTVMDYFDDEMPRGQISLYPETFQLDFFTAFCSILFAYSNHFTLVSLTKVIQRPTTGRIRFLIGGAGIASTCVYLTMGLFGYFHFGNTLSSEVLSAKQPITLPYAIGKLALGLVLVFSAPLLVEPTRASLEKLFDRKGEKTSPSRHYIITAGFMGTCLAIALGAGKAIQS